MNAPQTASEWVVRLNAHDCSAEERAAFAQWRDASPANAQAYEKCEKLWRFPKALAADAHMFANLAALSPAPNKSSRTMAHGPLAAFALAASLACLVIAGAWLFQQPPSAQVATGLTEQRTLTLPDGSIVTLNTRTTIATAFTEKVRQVDLPRGEAFFNVRPDAARPFVVRAGRSEIRVVGTQFAVRQEADRVEVVVREGRVEVLPDATRPIGDAALPMTVPLTSGKRLQFAPGPSRLEVASVDAEQATEWRNGVVRFEAATLEHMVAEMNRYTAKPLIIDGDALRSLEVSGRFRIGDTKGLLYALRERFGIEAREEGGVVRLSGADTR